MLFFEHKIFLGDGACSILIDFLIVFTSTKVDWCACLSRFTTNPIPFPRRLLNRLRGIIDSGLSVDIKINV